VAYGVILVPQRAAIDRLTRFAADLATGTSARFVVGENAIPHVTLLHAECHPEAAGVWWSRASQALHRTMSLRLAGLMYAPIPEGDFYTPEGGVYFGLEVARSPQIIGAHRTVLAQAEDLGLGIWGAVGDRFAPHLTLGVCETVPCAPVSLPGDLMGRPIEGRLAFGRLRNHGSFPPDLRYAGEDR